MFVGDLNMLVACTNCLTNTNYGTSSYIFFNSMTISLRAAVLDDNELIRL